MNIINNAIDGIGTGEGKIKIETKSKKDNVLIRIQDTGEGIKSDIQDKIFDPFFTTKPVGKGLGLGLSITYSIIQEHGGKITVKSEKNQGTVFTIELPKRQIPKQ